jgi:predicted AAA+ superfamily ATPase
MYNFITSHSKEPAVYIHGPQGVGKSYSLYQVVCALVGQHNTRVIYVPDCAFWGSHMYNEQLEFLLESIIRAFPDDPDIIAKCYAALTEANIMNLLEVIFISSCVSF